MRERAIFLGITAVVMACVAGLAAHMGGGPAAERAATVIVASDMHYIAPALTDHGEYFENMIDHSDGKVMAYAEEVMEAFAAQVVDRGADAVILSGDLTFNGARLSHEAMAEKLARIEQAGIPVLVIPGNHDLNNTNAARFQGDSFERVENIDAQTFAEIYGDFGFREALSRDEASLSYMYQVTPELWVLMVDVNTPDAPGTVKQATLAWVETQLRSAAQAGVRVMAVSHQNLLQHSSLFSAGYVMGNSRQLLALYEKYGVLCNLSGHMHMQHIMESDNGFPEIATASLVVPDIQYGVVTEAGYHTETVDMAAWAAAVGREDPELLDFTAYARGFFRHAGEETLGGDYPGGDAAYLARFMGEVNAAYFSGRMDELSWDEAAYETITGREDFLARYLESIAADGFRDMTRYAFSD